MKQRFSKRTRLVSAFLTLAMVFTFLPFSALADAGDISIDATNFPDENFRTVVETYDTDGSGFLSLSERNLIKWINCDNKGIESLEGIEHFNSLVKLQCNNNKLTKLNLSSNTSLSELQCSNNQLTTLVLSANTQLTKLQCNKNQLTSLDLSANTKLQELRCGDNNLGSLDISTSDLQFLYCSNNQLTSLNLNDHTSLKDVDCSNNELTTLEIGTKNNLMRISCQQNNLASLDVNKVPELQYLYCNSNQLTKLDVSHNPKLKELECENNQLTSLDVSKNINLEHLQCRINHLTSLDISNCAPFKGFNGDSNTYSITFDENMEFDLNTLPGHFDVTKSSNWENGKVDGTTLKPNGGNPGAVGYSYDCGQEKTVHFHLNVSYTHTHAYDGTWKQDESKHWHECTNSACPDKPGSVTDSAAHVYYNDADTTCKICGYVRSLTPETPDPGTTPGGSTPGGSTPGGSTGGGDGGGAVVIVAAVGAVAAGVVGYGVYNYVSGQKLQALLPEGVAAPENRAQTALLLWNTAGRPEPADAPAFADVADPDTAKAAQWCVEQGLMKRRLNGKFAPGSSIPAYQVLNAYRKLAGG